MSTRDVAWPDGVPCWVDLMTSDVVAARAFYSELFGWDIPEGAPEFGGYSSATQDGRAVCGIGQMMEAGHPPVWGTYLATADIDASVDSAVRAGATVFSPAMDVGPLGRMALLQDPAKGFIGFWQAGTHIGCATVNEPVSLTWNELMTRDYDASREFYTAVFSNTFTEIGDGENFRYSTMHTDGHIVGGVCAMGPEFPADVPSHWRVYFAVADTDATVEKAVSLGATVVQAPGESPYGRWAILSDPQGAAFNVIVPTGETQPW